MNIEYDKEGLVGFLLGPLGELLGDILHALLGPLFDIPILGDLLAGLIGERTDDIVIVDKEFNQNNVQSYPSLSEASNELKSLKYSPDANYIIFEILIYCRENIPTEKRMTGHRFTFREKWKDA